jgi:Zn-dependent protease with chaperone function
MTQSWDSGAHAATAGGVVDAGEAGEAGVGWGCWCGFHSRRRFGALLLAGSVAPGAALAQIPECKRSGFTEAVTAERIEKAAGDQYRLLLEQAGGKGALAPAGHPQLERLRYMARRMLPFTAECNARAAQWRWTVNLIGSDDINAFCMPGGKIGFFHGILARLQLDDDEVAAIMGHEIAHALLEHAREQVGKSAVTSMGLRLGAAVLGLGNVGDFAAQLGSQLLSLKFSRSDETEADALGLLVAAKAGYDPRAGVSLWRKMMAASGGKSPPGWLSTHPTNADRIRDIEARQARVKPEFEQAPRPDRRFAPPPPPAPRQRGN